LGFQASKSVVLRAAKVRSIIFGPIAPLAAVLLQQIDMLGPPFTELARTAILAIGYSMLRTGKRPAIAELGS
jgi:hypothetical protein